MCHSLASCRWLLPRLSRGEDPEGKIEDAPGYADFVESRKQRGIQQPATTARQKPRPTDTADDAGAEGGRDVLEREYVAFMRKQVLAKRVLMTSIKGGHHLSKWHSNATVRVCTAPLCAPCTRPTRRDTRLGCRCLVKR